MKTVAIIGAGAGGLSILWKIKQSKLAPLRILMVDPHPESIADRNWCQWVKPDQRMPFHSTAWSGIRCRTPKGTYDQQCREWLYVRTTGRDYRNYIDSCPSGDHHIEWVNAMVLEVNDHQASSGVSVVTDRGSMEVDMIFSSRPTRPLSPLLWQHFHGWHVEVDTPVFDPTKVTLMDFEVPQPTDGVTFFYVLPYTEHTALVECTVFSAQVWETPRYESYLNEYLNDRFGLKEGNMLSRTVETGKIPMDSSKKSIDLKLPTSDTFRQTRVNPPQRANIWAIGAEAGAIKPSTGYAFSRIQAMASHLIHTWESLGDPMPLPPSSPRFRWYDTLLLGIIREHPDQVVTIFDHLFRYVPIDRTFRFLDEGSSLADEAGIFWHLPKRPFLRQACKHVIS